MKLIRYVVLFFNVDGVVVGVDLLRNFDKFKNKGGFVGLKLK